NAESGTKIYLPYTSTGSLGNRGAGGRGPHRARFSRAGVRGLAGCRVVRSGSPSCAGFEHDGVNVLPTHLPWEDRTQNEWLSPTSAVWVSLCHSDSLWLLSRRMQLFQRSMGSSLPSGRMAAASLKQRSASSTVTSCVWGGRPAASCALA